MIDLIDLQEYIYNMKHLRFVIVLIFTGKQ